MTPWKPILAALVIFAAGLTIGRLILPEASSASRDGRPSPERDERPPGERRGGQPGRPPWSPVLSEEQISGICGRMVEDLKLNLVQSNQVANILRESQARMKAIADEYLPRTREEFHRTREEIKAILTEEQLAKYEEGFRKWQERAGRRGAGGPPKDGAGRIDHRHDGPPPGSPPPEESSPPSPGAADSP